MRVVLIVLDSFGVGGAPDAEKYGDFGANTLGNIASECEKGNAESKGVRTGKLFLPNMDRLGLGLAAIESTGQKVSGLGFSGQPESLWGVAREISNGKDTPSGHWEIAGVPVLFDWGYFLNTEPCFPDELTQNIIMKAGLKGILGNKHASGTEIIRELGEKHIQSGFPILYTSADSVLQIAAHEVHFGLDNLYTICKICRELVDRYNIGRVIARPFIGESANSFKRTENRRDYSVPPPSPTILDRVVDSGHEVIAIGKIADIFAHQGISKSVKAGNNQSVVDAIIDELGKAKKGDLIFANLVDFDMLYGHRRDVTGYAKALEDFDRQLPVIQKQLVDGDLVIITADHGCDPTWTGTEHTREQVPILAFGSTIQGGPIGTRRTFADIGETVAEFLGLEPGSNGVSFLKS